MLKFLNKNLDIWKILFFTAVPLFVFSLFYFTIDHILSLAAITYLINIIITKNQRIEFLEEKLGH